MRHAPMSVRRPQVTVSTRRREWWAVARELTPQSRARTGRDRRIERSHRFRLTQRLLQCALELDQAR